MERMVEFTPSGSGEARILPAMATRKTRVRVNGSGMGPGMGPGMSMGLATLSLGVSLLACGSSPPPEATAPKPEVVSKRVAAPPSGPLPRFALAHWPWHGIRTTVEVQGEGESISLRVYRSIDPQYLATWKVPLGTDAKDVEDLVNGLTSSAGTVHACPRPHGPDGALWIARGFATKTDTVADFRVEGGAECGKFEDLAVKLMQLAKLECGFSACLRPEELQSGKFSCALGSEGDECRNPSNEQNTIPRELKKGLRG